MMPIIAQTFTQVTPEPYKHIHPTPEPSFYGVIFVGLVLAMIVWFRLRPQKTS